MHCRTPLVLSCLISLSPFWAHGPPPWLALQAPIESGLDEVHAFQTVDRILGDLQISTEGVDVAAYRAALQKLTKCLTECHSADQLNAV